MPARSRESECGVGAGSERGVAPPFVVGSVGRASRHARYSVPVAGLDVPLGPGMEVRQNEVVADSHSECHLKAIGRPTI